MNIRGFTVQQMRRRRARAFTLIEIMTALFIFCMVVAAIFASWQAIVHGAVSGNRAAAEAQRSRMALRTLEVALGSTRSFVADVEYYTFDADNGTEPYLSFVSRLSPEFPRSGEFGEFNVRRVTFSVEPGPDNGGKRLVLRQNAVLSDMPEDEQNYPVVLANDVTKFEMEFYDKQKADWLDEWDQTNQLPQMVKFTLQLGDQEPMTRIVALPCVAVQSGWQIPGSTFGGRSAGSGIGGGFPGQFQLPGAH